MTPTPTSNSIRDKVTAVSSRTAILEAFDRGNKQTTISRIEQNIQ